MHRKIKSLSQAVGKNHIKSVNVRLASSVCNCRVSRQRCLEIALQNLKPSTTIFSCVCFYWNNLLRSQVCVFSAIMGVRWKSNFRQAPLLTAAPTRVLIDEQISIRGHFLPPHSPVTAYAQMHCEDNDRWESFAHYNTDAHGTVNCELYWIFISGDITY